MKRKKKDSKKAVGVHVTIPVPPHNEGKFFASRKFRRKQQREAIKKSLK